MNLREIIQSVRPDLDLTASGDISLDGVLDSFDIVQLVVAMDKGYRIAIKGTDILPENFASTSSIESLLRAYGVADQPA